ncbi:hypothetical protein ACFSL4_04750 [Streptomyces caeni]|uniref:Ig-like domain-containing protein n=1 Tax=Streptomyces caeni TaxID=2307231 RepID=A0ABW4IJQ7_9ACTN
MNGPRQPHGQEPTPRRAEDADPTIHLPQDENPTVRLPQDEAATVELSKGRGPTDAPAATEEPTVDLASDEDPTVDLAPDGHAPTVDLAPGDHAPTVDLAPDEDSTVRLPEEGKPEPGSEAKSAAAAAADDDYRATLLASHWVQRSAPEEDLPPTVPGGQPAPPAAATTAPDRIDGRVLRFGPGVTMADRDRSGTTVLSLPPAPRPRPARSPVLRRYTLPAVVLLGVLLFLAWQRFGPSVAVRDVRVSTDSRGPGCDGTADVVALLSTDGRPGTVTYRWERSDGTTSGSLTEKLPRGRSTARLHLLWTFHGEGRYQARATLRILSPGPRTATTSFTYRCP